MKNAFDGLINGLNTAEERIFEFQEREKDKKIFIKIMG